MDSIMAISNFMEENRLTSDEVGNVRFEALVDYRSPARSMKVLTQVKITRNGFNDGDIEIGECEDLNVTDYHLGSTRQYQTYSFNDDKLLIKGTSNKMGGNYTITISVFK